MIQFDPYNLAVMVEAGFVYLGMQRFREAVEVFEGVHALAPENDIPIVALGNVEFCRGQLAKAVRHYKSALKVSPDSLFAKVYLGEALLFEGKKDEGLGLLSEVKKTDPRGAAGGFAISLLDAVRDGFEPHLDKPQKRTTKKKASNAKKTKKTSR